MTTASSLVITGATGLTGSYLLRHLAQLDPHPAITCLVRPTSDRTALNALPIPLNYWVGDSNRADTWSQLLTAHQPQTIIHIASLRHVPALLTGLHQTQQQPRLIVVGTTGVYSQYNSAAAIYRTLEAQLTTYSGACCLLRPTMIYGSQRDQNLHKLIRFCHRYHCFPVFGRGDRLLQPIHADDLAQALLAVWQHSQLQGSYDLSGGSIISFRALLALVADLLQQPVLPISVPIHFGLGLATLLEQLFQEPPLRREQILRLQEDKVYAHTAATEDFGFAPRALEVGLRQEIAQLRHYGYLP